MSDAIDDYLDELAGRAHPGGARFRRVLAEAEEHLRESAASLRRAGMDEGSAACEAVSRFGPVEPLVAEARPSATVWAADAVRAAWLLGSTGLAAVGLSGVLAWALQAVAGARFVAGDTNGVTYTTARCADFLEYYPHAGSCSAAAALHHADEVVMYRVLAGVLGLVGLLAYLWWGRSGTGHQRVLPAVTVPAVAAAAFLLAAVALLLSSLGLALGERVHGEAWSGIGSPLSGGVVSLVAAVLAGLLVLRRVPRRTPWAEASRGA
jgi:hypothetical protein